MARKRKNSKKKRWFDIGDTLLTHWRDYKGNEYRKHRAYHYLDPSQRDRTYCVTRYEILTNNPSDLGMWQPHRLDGPAIVRSGGKPPRGFERKEYWVDGERLTKFEFNFFYRPTQRITPEQRSWIKLKHGT